LDEGGKMNKHTPGPWKAFTGWVGLKPGHGPVIAQIPNYPYGDTEANAHLIAAAPDLLEVAKRALNMSARVHPDFYTQIRAAIAKAEGDK
jgi:hypothetical protein